MKLELSGQIFQKSSNIKFHENPSSESPVIPCGRTGITKLIVAYRNFTKSPKKSFKKEIAGYRHSDTENFILTAKVTWRSVERDTHQTPAYSPLTFKHFSHLPPTLEFRRRRHKCQVSVT
jgi:hypothetical protein